MKSITTPVPRNLVSYFSTTVAQGHLPYTRNDALRVQRKLTPLFNGPSLSGITTVLRENSETSYRVFVLLLISNTPSLFLLFFNVRFSFIVMTGVFLDSLLLFRLLGMILKSPI